MESVITVENVDLWYEKDKPTEVHALKNINLSIRKGDYVAFFGPSGCGKTTMLYAIAGIDRYQNGKITINGKDMTNLSKEGLAYFRQTDIGIVFQQFNLLPSLTVLQNVALPMSFRGIPSDIAEQEAKKLLDRLNLSAYSKRYPFELSGGQQQRVAIARAIANDPPIIIADEPLGNLDSVNAKNVLAFLKELNEKDGRTIIMVTHEAWSLQDVKTIFYIKDGQITGTDTAAQESIAESLKEHLNKEIMPGQGMGHSSEEGSAAGALASILLPGYSLSELNRLEDLLTDRIEGKLDAAAFYKKLHTSFTSGGMGLWKFNAKKIASQVESIIAKKQDIANFQKELATHPERTLGHELYVIRDWLIDGYDEEKIDHIHKESLDQIISDRIRGFITQEDFINIASRPFEKFGVGVTPHTALYLSQKLESLLNGDTLVTVPEQQAPSVPETAVMASEEPEEAHSRHVIERVL